MRGGEEEMQEEKEIKQKKITINNKEE